MPEHGERLARLEERMNKVEEGVSNFILFQRKGDAFFTEFRVRADEQDKYQRRRDFWITTVLAILGIVVAVIAALEANRQLHSKFSLDQNPAVLSSNQVQISGPPPH